MSIRYRILQTRCGFMGYAASPLGVRRVILPQAAAAQIETQLLREFPNAQEDRTLLPELADALVRYFAGEPVSFDTPLDCPDAPPFERRVWTACQEVGYGKTATYKDLARAAGNAGAARAAGSAMAHNRFPVLVPCHRILRSDGALGGYSGPGGVDFKRELLDLEAAACATPA